MISTGTYEGAELESMARLQRYCRWIVSFFIPTLRGEGVEYGAGLGTVSAHLAPHLRALTLVEPTPSLAGALASRFSSSPHISVVQDSLEHHARRSPGEFDCATLINVLEHIEDDRAALRLLHGALKPAGSLHLFVPALPQLHSRFDDHLGHFRRYTLAGLTAAVQQSGFSISEARYMDALGIAPWWLMYRVFGSLKMNPAAATLYDRVAVPIGRRLESRCAPPLGKSIVLIARK